MEMSYVNKACIPGLEPYPVDNSRSPFYQFLVQWVIVGTIIPINYFFIRFFSSILFLFLSLF